MQSCIASSVPTLRRKLLSLSSSRNALTVREATYHQRNIHSYTSIVQRNLSSPLASPSPLPLSSLNLSTGYSAQGFILKPQIRDYSSLYAEGEERPFMEYKELQERFYKEHKIRIIHFGTKKDYELTTECIHFIEDNYKDRLIQGVGIMLYDGETIMGEDLTLVKVNRNILNSQNERDRFVDLLNLLRKILYRERMSPAEIQRWHVLRGSGVVLPDYFKDILITRRYGVKGRTIFGLFITDSDLAAYSVLIGAIVTLLAMALYGSIKKSRDMDRAEENYMRMLAKVEKEKEQKEKITEMALERQRAARSE